MEIRKINRRRSCSAERGDFTSLFCRGQQRNSQRFIAHVHSYRFTHQPLLGGVLVAVVVAVCVIEAP